MSVHPIRSVPPLSNEVLSLGERMDASDRLRDSIYIEEQPRVLSLTAVLTIAFLSGMVISLVSLIIAAQLVEWAS